MSNHRRDDDEESYDLFGDEDSGSEDINESDGDDDSNYSYEEADPSADTLRDEDESDFEDEPIGEGNHRMAKRGDRVRSRMESSGHSRRSGGMGGGGSSHSRGQYSMNGGSYHSRGGRSIERAPPINRINSNSYLWNESFAHSSFSGPPGSVVAGMPQPPMRMDAGMGPYPPGTVATGPPPGSVYGQDNGYYEGGGFASRIRRKLPKFEANQDTRTICAFCICIFLFICAGVAAGAYFIGQGRVDIFEGVPDISLGDDKEDLLDQENRPDSNDTIVPTLSPQPTAFVPLNVSSIQPSVSPTGQVGTTALPTTTPTQLPNLFEPVSSSQLPTIPPTSSSPPTEQATEVIVVPDPVVVVASGDVMIRDDIPDGQFGSDDFLLIQNSDTIKSFALLTFDLGQVYNASLVPSTSSGPNRRRQRNLRRPSAHSDKITDAEQSYKQQRGLSTPLSESPFEVSAIIQMVQIVGIDPNRQPAPFLTLSRIEPLSLPDVEQLNLISFVEPSKILSKSFNLPGDIAEFSIDVTDLLNADVPPGSEQTMYLLLESRGENNNELGVELRSREYLFGTLAPQLTVSFAALPTSPPVEASSNAPTVTSVTESPTTKPTKVPTPAPSSAPTTLAPTSSPTISKIPTVVLTAQPFSFGFGTPEPSPRPQEVSTDAPTTASPTAAPADATVAPTLQPVPVLTAQPFSFGFGTPEPSALNGNTNDDGSGSRQETTDTPTGTPTNKPTRVPTTTPAEPTNVPTLQPVPVLTAQPFSFGFGTPEPSVASGSTNDDNGSGREETTASPSGKPTPVPTVEAVTPTNIPTPQPVPVLTAQPFSFGFGTPEPSETNGRRKMEEDQRNE